MPTWTKKDYEVVADVLHNTGMDEHGHQRRT
jgi:hypothetical protein